MNINPHLKYNKPSKTTRNYNVKPPKIGGGQGKRVSNKISDALGIAAGQAVHKNAVKQLLSHPDQSVVKEAQKILKKF